MTALWRSLRTRLLASSILIAACSITATAWLSVQGTSESLRVEQGETLAADTRIHDTLVGYAATHADWDSVDGTVRVLAEETGRRIALVTENLRPIADSRDRSPLPPRASSVVDPLAVDVTLASEGAGRIDPRAVGPFTVAGSDLGRLTSAAEESAACLNEEFGILATVETAPSGRPYVNVSGSEEIGSLRLFCGLTALEEPVTSERTALEDLAELTASCLDPAGPEVVFRIDGTTGTPIAVPRNTSGLTQEEEEALWAEGALSSAEVRWMEPLSPELDRHTADCVDSARRDLLAPYVAPAALLFIDDPAENPAASPSLSREGVLRVSGVVLLVLVLTLVVSVTVSTQLVRPVHALTDAVLRMRAGQGAGRVEVRDPGELGQLATAFNEMSEHLERLEEQRKAMVSDVSHELRTPLSNLRGWLEAAQDGVADLHPERMGMLVGETLLLQAIIDDLQDLALADAGRLRLSPERVEARVLVEQVVASYRLRSDEAGLRLVAEADGTVLSADPTRLAQALGNLVGNALRHTPKAGTVTVRAWGEEGEAIFQVADTGAGIAPEDLPQVFDRFWRAEKSRSRQTGGSGLGLAIVRGLVELHGGSAAVRSTLGVGSVFTLRLPLSGPTSTGSFRPAPNI
ncbi:cell wall metabolism sensor histidine kinase WalK [Nocardiopsis sp. CNT312]|uniref:sensor histidine kinase n=1 Tax=Nocardiopsis sp. CNT312 TaxID=1137268 RepID=UPI0004B876DF|nr:ATP-binding protein [Nocardiopsis sp. CNT312]